jgi:cytochrome c553
MKTKISTIATTAAVLCLFGGALCWSAKAADVIETWTKDCASCHGKDGKAQTPMGKKLGMKDLTDAKVQAALTDEQATKDIKEGVTEDGKTKMKPFADKLSDDEVKALVAHVRSLKQ